MDYRTNDTKGILLNDNKTAIKIIMGIALLVSISYLTLLPFIFTTNGLGKIDILFFIKVFDVILAIVAVGSCMLCYNSTKKEELFILSLVHIIFVFDILLGNVDNLNLISTEININDYIFLGTSILRISMLLISILPFYRLKKLIIENKIKSVISIVLIVTLFSMLKINNVINLDFKDVYAFVYYNIVLVIVYLIVSVAYLLKSLRSKECIYSVISASTLIFTTKWIYAIIGTINPSESTKLISISITYMGFIILILGVTWELIINIKINKQLKQELIIFKKIADENKSNCIIIYEGLENIIYSNEAAKKYLSKSKDKYKDDLMQSISEAITEVGKEQCDEIYNKIYDNAYWQGIIENKFRDTTINCSIQSISTDDKKHTVVTFNDITQKLREQKYLKEYEKMKTQEQVRTEFFANISHELRTPLNIFYSTIQLLDLKVESDEKEFIKVYKNYKRTLKVNCQRMLRLINNIVDITKIDVGFTKPVLKNYDIIRLVEDITLSVINYAKHKEVNIIFDTEEEEQIIKCDKDMIERVMLNLLSNAIKFTNTGGNILVDIFVDEEWIHVRVKDDGIGIPIEDQSYIFERFVQTDKSLTRLNEGSGIGLSIVNSIVQLHEGEIYVDSDGTNGTEFEILLPNKKLDDYIEEVYNVDSLKIELELSDIYELY